MRDMKDMMARYVDEHKFEHPDGTWSWADQDEPTGHKPKIYATEAELDDVLWQYICDNPDLVMPSIYLREK